MNKRYISQLLIILSLALSACQTSGSEVAPESVQPTATPIPVQATATPVPTQENTLSAADKFATAIAADQATQAAGPTKEPSVTPKPVATIDPNVDYWWNDTVFYEIFVRSFYDSDGDGVGDINGLIEKLDYLNDGDPATTDDLGITGIWLMPIMESPSYHGYDVVDYYTVDEEYGTNDDFQSLMEEAHRRDIRVIVDLVLNHTSSQHPWFLDSRDEDSDYRDWYIWSDTNPGYAGPWGQVAWHRSFDSYYYGVFWSGMPDINLRNPEATAQLQDIARFWLEEMGVDGFRLDATKHLIEDGPAQENTNATHDWLGGFFTFYKSVDPEAFAVGEAWTGTLELLDYTGDEVDVVFAFDLAENMIDAARGPFAGAVADRTAQMVERFPAGQYATFLANHDQNRLMSQLLGDVDQAKLAATLLLTSPGVPFLYYGEEIGMLGTKPDEDIRLPMQWSKRLFNAGFTSGIPWRLPEGDYRTKNVAAQTNDPDSLLSHYRELIHLRNQHPALRTGEWLRVDSTSEYIYAFLRYTAEEVLLILVNAHRESVTLDNYSLSLGAGPLSEGVQIVPLLGLDNPKTPTINTQGGFSDYAPFINIPAKGFAVVQLSP